MFAVKRILLLIYFAFGLLLNSVGVVILQVIRVYGVSKEAASSLEGLKDMPIAWVSLLVGPYLVKIGYKTSMVVALTCVSLACWGMTEIKSFGMAQLMFLVAGCSFALVKVAVYSTIGLVTVDASAHASLLSLVEGCFMLGVLAGYWLFGFFMSPGSVGSEPADHQSEGWLRVYFILCALSGMLAVLVALTPFDGVSKSASAHEANGGSSGARGLVAVLKEKSVLCYLFTAFLYVMVEQGIGTWLPTFNSEVLLIRQDLSVQLTSLFAAGLAFGRLGAGYVLRRVEWHVCIYVCICGAFFVLVVGLCLASVAADSARFVVPCVGFFLAPVYPSLTSAVMSSIPKNQQPSLTGLVTMASAVGGSSGSLMTGVVFAKLNGIVAFSMSLPPLLFISILVHALRKTLEANRESRKLNIGIPPRFNEHNL
eukprot:TRINITY_DN19264_c0_g1_i1.p1 TRINITY_DN19264_c0_g1~~TRINITY_DN19264_c0_g1_i1.p1  ORF type:complete len:450 (+),score=51.51 TRINITY_DN19264_c0_g1_i1:78-1352(+)